MAMAVKEEQGRRSSGSLSSSSSSPSPPRSLDKYELLPHPKYTPRTMRRKRKPPRCRTAKSLTFPNTSTEQVLLPPTEDTRIREERKKNSATTSDYGTLSLNNCIEMDSVLSHSLSSMSLLGEEKRPHDGPMEYLRLNNSSFVIYPHPLYNLRSSFSVELTNEKALVPTSSLIQISEAIVVTKYNLTQPALYCMNCEHSRVHVYKRLFTTFIHNTTVKVQSNFLVFEIDSEGTYVVFVSRKDPVIKYARVNPRKSTLFRLTDDPLIEVIFEKDSVDERFRLKGQVFFEELHTEHEYLASPIISLSPHGATFNKEVQIRIEILEIEKSAEFSERNLKLFVDRKNFENTWSPITDFKLVEDENGKKFVVFSVRHFSLFKVVWEGVKRTGTGLISSLLGRSSGAVESFQMKCQASMDEYENNHFGLEVCVFRADKSFPEVMNYAHVVGKSLSKNVKCGGQVTISLKSSLFRADTEAGEQEEMVKDENDFKGQDFSRDFALVFNENIKQRRGPFGKVFVSRRDENRAKETIFEFNIQKQGNEADRRDQGAGGPGTSNVAEQWSTVPLEELATNLFITDADNWKRLAKNLGFTKLEIKGFKGKPSPFKSTLDAFKSRGGEVKNFVKAIYDTNREIKMGSHGITGSPMSDSSKVSPGRVSRSASSGLGSSRHSQNLLYQRSNDISSSSSSDTSDNEIPGGGSAAASIPPPDFPAERPAKRKRAKGGGKHSHRKRRRRHDTTTSSSASSDSSREDLKTNKNSSHNSKYSDRSLRLDTRKLTEAYLWNLSKFLTNSQWKAVGRTLQVEESQLTAIMTQHTSGGNREHFFQMLLAWSEKYPSKCTFGTLYSALIKENMVSVAKKMDKVYRESS